MNKRGLSQVFKYILVAIAGAVILIFFINFARQQITTQQDLDSAVLSRILNSNFDAFSISGNADKTIDLGGEHDVYFNRFGCGKVGVDEVQPIPNNNIIFGPSETRDNKLDIWTARWNMPFPVTNFFYAAGEDTQIVIEGNNDLAKSLRGEGNNVEFIPKRFLNSGEQVKTIYLEERQVIGKDVAIYNVNECDELKDNYLCKGHVRFSDGESVFIGKEMMYAAIFSENLNDYKCGVERGFGKLTQISEIYRSKANPLIPNCNKMVALRNNLENLKDINLNSALELDVNSLVSLNKEVRSECGNYLF